MPRTIASTRNPLTQARASSKSLWMPGVNGNYAYTPSNSSLNLVNIDIRVYCESYNFNSLRQNFVGKWGASTNQRSYQLGIDVNSSINFQVSTDGTAATIKTMSATCPFSSGSPGWFRATLLASTGAWVIYTSTDGNTWTSRVSGSLGATTPFASDTTAPLEVGTLSVGTSIPFWGYMYYVDVRNNLNNDGTGIVANPDFRIASASGFSDSEGNVWTINTSGVSVAKLVARSNASARNPVT